MFWWKVCGCHWHSVLPLTIVLMSTPQMLTIPLVNYYILKIKLQLLQTSVLNLEDSLGLFQKEPLSYNCPRHGSIQSRTEREAVETWSLYNLLERCLISERQTSNLHKGQNPVVVSAEWLMKLRCCLGAACGMEWFAYAALGVFMAILSFLMDLSVTKLLRGTRACSYLWSPNSTLNGGEHKHWND